MRGRGRTPRQWPGKHRHLLGASGATQPVSKSPLLKPGFGNLTSKTCYQGWKFLMKLSFLIFYFTELKKNFKKITNITSETPGSRLEIWGYVPMLFHTAKITDSKYNGKYSINSNNHKHELIRNVLKKCAETTWVKAKTSTKEQKKPWAIGRCTVFPENTRLCKEIHFPQTNLKM